MQLLSFISTREMGLNRNMKTSERLFLNVDFALQRLISEREDTYVLHGEDIEVPPFACQFNKVKGQDHILGVASEEGDILLLDTNSLSNERLVSRWRAHSNAIFDICWLKDKPNLITASGDQTAVIWDVLSKQRIATFKGHSGTVKSIDVSPLDNAVFATGSRDGSVMLWDSRCRSKGNHHAAETVIRDAHNATSLIGGTPKQRKKHNIFSMGTNPLNSVTSVCFQDQHLLLSAGVTDGIIKVWDLRKTYSVHKKQSLPRYQLPYSGSSSKAHGFTSLIFDSTYSQLYACCTDNVIYHYNCLTYEPVYVSRYYGFKASTYFVKMTISNNDQYLLSGSSDNKAYIWKISKPGPPVFQLSGHSAEVTAVAWNPVDITKLATCGDDERILFWKVGKKYMKKDMNNESNIIGTAEAVNFSVQKTYAEFASPSAVATTSSSSPAVGTYAHQLKRIPSSLNSPSITHWFSPSSSFSLDSASTLSGAETPDSEICKKASILNRNSSSTENISLSDSVRRKRKHGESVSKPNTFHGDIVFSPLGRKVLSPSKSCNIANRMSVNNTRRTLNLDSIVSNLNDRCYNQITEHVDHSSQSSQDKENQTKPGTLKSAAEVHKISPKKQKMDCSVKERPVQFASENLNFSNACVKTSPTEKANIKTRDIKCISRRSNIKRQKQSLTVNPITSYFTSAHDKILQ